MDNGAENISDLREKVQQLEALLRASVKVGEAAEARLRAYFVALEAVKEFRDVATPKDILALLNELATLRTRLTHFENQAVNLREENEQLKNALRDLLEEAIICTAGAADKAQSVLDALTEKKMTVKLNEQ